jgi:hypothetical protein
MAQGRFKTTGFAETAGSAIRKPFGEYVEGLISETSRADRTPLELFIAGVKTNPCRGNPLSPEGLNTATLKG